MSFQAQTLSTIISKYHPEDSKFELSFRDIDSIGILNSTYTVLTQLDLSYNRLTTLKGLEQFRFLSHLNVSHNLLQTTDEFDHIHSKSLLVYLSAKGNPIARHPDYTAMLISKFPCLTELDCNVVSSSAKSDIEDAKEISNNLLAYFYENEQLMLVLNSDIKYMRLKLELIEKVEEKTDPCLLPDYKEIEEVHFAQSKLFPLITEIPCVKQKHIKPYTITEFMKSIKQDIPHLNFEIEEDTLCRIYKWIYCEILLYLHNIGYHDLECFLEEYDTLDDGLSSDLVVFSNLSPTGSVMEFPVFGCNSEYLKALFSVLQKQALALQALLAERFRLYTTPIIKNETLSILKEPSEDVLKLMEESADSILSPPRKSLEKESPDLQIDKFCSPSFPEEEYISPSNRKINVEPLKLSDFESPRFPGEISRERLGIPGNSSCIPEEISKLEYESELNFSTSMSGSFFMFNENYWEIKTEKKVLFRLKKYAENQKNYRNFRFYIVFQRKKKVLLFWRRVVSESIRDKENKALIYRKNKLLKKSFENLKLYSSPYDYSRIKANNYNEFRVKGLVFYAMKRKYKFNLSVRKIRKENLEKEVKHLIPKILRAWLYLVRPSAQYSRRREPVQASSIDRLLTRIHQHRSSVTQKFKQLKKKTIF